MSTTSTTHQLQTDRTKLYHYNSDAKIKKILSENCQIFLSNQMTSQAEVNN